MLDFKNWIINQNFKKSNIQELQLDVLMDDYFPYSTDKATIIEYLKSKGECPRYIDTFTRAFRRYKAYTEKAESMKPKHIKECRKVLYDGCKWCEYNLVPDLRDGGCALLRNGKEK